MKNKNNNTEADHSIDISDEICPMTFVKTKLLIERMGVGETADVRLQGHEPLNNVPRSVREFGHEVLSLEPEEEGAAADSIHHLLIRKN